jgi:uncharacterized protein
MKIVILELTLRANWVHSLKEKRMILKSLLSRIKNQFNVSVAEIGHQDSHQLIHIGIVSIAHNNAQADSIIENILHFVETNTEADIFDIQKEII